MSECPTSLCIDCKVGQSTPSLSAPERVSPSNADLGGQAALLPLISVREQLSRFTAEVAWKTLHSGRQLCGGMWPWVSLSATPEKKKKKRTKRTVRTLLRKTKVDSAIAFQKTDTKQETNEGKGKKISGLSV